MGMVSSSQSVIEAKRAQRTKALEAVKSSLAIVTENGSQPKDSVILRATAAEIVKNIGSDVWTATQVVNAFIRRALLAQERTNCLTEVLFIQAQERAKKLDEEFAVTRKLKGPLHGVPISIKDLFDIEGVDSAIGFTTWANNPATRNADSVEYLQDAGAVILTKTNVPQTMLAFECNNPLWGRTVSPWNSNYSSGGSSGGEAALLAMDGSAIGFGTDIGGSLRIPTAYCGIYSLKPGTGRISFLGSRDPVKGNENIKAVAGPLGRTVEDVELVCRLLFGKQKENLDVVPLPFREVTLSRKLRFGYYTSDGFVKASPACKRAVVETVRALEKQGHECVEIEVPSSISVFVSIIAADGYKTLLSHLGPDPMDSSLFLPTLGPRLPSFVRNFVSWLVKNVVGDTAFGSILHLSRVRPVEDVYKVVAQMKDFRRAFNAKIWEKYDLDGIIAPVQAVPQCPHGGSNWHSLLSAATFLYNVTDYPVGCLPVTRVDASKDQLTDEWMECTPPRSKIMEKGLYHGKDALYDPVKSHGLPVGIQIVGRKWQEEKVLAMMKVVDGALGPRSFGPGAWDESTIHKSGENVD